ncbi:MULTISPECIES: hypothetical protein [unclassified Microbacterium]|uniref:hypothetical protein n=1 Tax=unclassified Microbacterium TaxID=2609290 RepID=UPI003C2C06AE
MSTEIVPTSTKLAAKRGFVRTTAQAYAATLSAGLPSAAVIVAVIQDPTGWLLAGITIALTLASPPAAGLASYLSIVSNGVPGEYVEAALNEAAESDGFTTPEG